MSLLELISLSILLLLGTSIEGTTISTFERPPSLIPMRSAIIRDARYAAWPNATRILYRIDSSFTADERAMIVTAVSQIAADTSRCVGFQEWTAANTGSDHIYISKTLNNGVAAPTCFSFPGRVLSQAGQGQKLVIFPGADGCMSVREIMKFLLHSLGIRNEFNRPDRDVFITVFPNNIRPNLQSLNILQKYTAAQVDYSNTLFDYQSVTLPNPAKYANPGQQIIQANGGQTFGNLPRLSQGDCVGLSILYGCNFNFCQDPYTAGVVTGLPTTGTTLVPTVPTVPPVPVFTNPPDPTGVTGPIVIGVGR